MRFVFVWFLLINNVSMATEPTSTDRETCITPFGEVLGKDPQEVIAYSNCNPYIVNNEAMKRQGQFTGLKWQCVEYARRWLLTVKGLTFSEVDFAYEIWDKINHYKQPGTDKVYKTTNYVNGSTTEPAKGDLLIYEKNFLGTGHVAVIIGKDKQFLLIAEQNYLNQTWPASYARKIKLHKDDGRYWLLDSYLIGWKRVAVE